MEFIPTIFALVGLALCLLVAGFVVKGAILSLSPASWAEHWPNASFITFSWHELGRAIFLGLIAAVGAMPLAIAFFAGSDGFLSNVIFLSAISWATFALAIFFIGIGTGLVGFLRHEFGEAEGHAFTAVLQFLIVSVACLPALILFVVYLMPNVSTILGLWIDTMGLYAKIIS